MDSKRLKYCSDDGSPRAKFTATNWLDPISGSADFDTVEVTFKNTRNGYFTNPDRLPLKIGDLVAVEAAPGHDIGRVSMVGRLVRLQMEKNGAKTDTPLKRVFRLATQADLEKFEEARSREHSTMIRTRKIAEDLGLNMKIGDVEYQGDGGKAIFYYIADDRVDFRKLIRILADTFKIRVEMKQIGARQEAGRIGGIGPCGRPLCCSSWMTHFVSVGTGAARQQDLSMNPQKLAGQCAKLKCCLNFETDLYVEAAKKMPPKDVQLETKDNLYYYFKPDILAHKVTYSTDRKIPANLVTIDAARAFEIIALNKQGVKVDSLLDEEEEEAMKSEKAVDLVEQESLTRFDRSKKKKKQKKQKAEKKGEQKGEPKAEQKAKGEPKAEQKQKTEQKAEQKGEHKTEQKGDQKGNRRNRSRRRKDAGNPTAKPSDKPSDKPAPKKQD